MTNAAITANQPSNVYVADWAQKVSSHKRSPGQVIGTFLFAFTAFAVGIIVVVSQVS